MKLAYAHTSPTLFFELDFISLSRYVEQSVSDEKNESFVLFSWLLDRIKEEFVRLKLQEKYSEFTKKQWYLEDTKNPSAEAGRLIRDLASFAYEEITMTYDSNECDIRIVVTNYLASTIYFSPKFLRAFERMLYLGIKDQDGVQITTLMNSSSLQCVKNDARFDHHIQPDIVCKHDFDPFKRSYEFYFNIWHAYISLMYSNQTKELEMLLNIGFTPNLQYFNECSFIMGPAVHNTLEKHGVFSKKENNVWLGHHDYRHRNSDQVRVRHRVPCLPGCEKASHG